MIAPKLQFTLLRAWHAWLSGGFVVAWITADEDTYAMHQFAGYAVLAAILVRLLAALIAPKGSPWRLPRPRLNLLSTKGRNPLLAWFAAALLAGVGLAALTGTLADVAPWMEDPHEAASELTLWLIFAHVGFVLYLFGGKRLLNSLPLLKEKMP